MTEQEYKDALKVIDDERITKWHNLIKQYAKSQRKFGIGDIIQQYDTLLKIENFGTYAGMNMPEVVYRGIELKKDLTPKKRQDGTAIYGNNNVVLIKGTVLTTENLEIPK